MRLKESITDGVDLFALEGEIDLHYAPVLRSLLLAKIAARTPALIVDLTAVDYIDSSGLAVFIEYYRDASKHSGVLCLVGLRQTLKSIFEMVRLDRAIPMFATTTDAVAALHKGSVHAPSPALFGSPAA